MSRSISAADRTLRPTTGRPSSSTSIASRAPSCRLDHEPRSELFDREPRAELHLEPVPHVGPRLDREPRAELRPHREPRAELRPFPQQHRPPSGRWAGSITLCLLLHHGRKRCV
jgi:hypothetical protein